MQSQAKKQGLVWGGLLILFGVVALLETFADLSAWVWVAALVAGGLGVGAGTAGEAKLVSSEGFAVLNETLRFLFDQLDISTRYFARIGVG